MRKPKGIVEVFAIADKYRSQDFVVNCGFMGAGVLQLN